MLNCLPDKNTNLMKKYLLHLLLHSKRTYFEKKKKKKKRKCRVFETVTNKNKKT